MVKALTKVRSDFKDIKELSVLCRIRRMQRGLTIKELADKIGSISNTTIGMMENGNPPNPPIFDRIMHELGIDLAAARSALYEWKVERLKRELLSGVEG